MKKRISIAVAALWCCSTGAGAQVSQAEWEQFKAQFAAMSDRVSALEAENKRLRSQGQVSVEDLAATNAEVASLNKRHKASSWAENTRWQGDFLYRYEEIQQQGRSDQDRNRVRARAALVANLPDDIEVGLGMATGGDSPVSTMQTLGGGGSTKELRLDLAYAKWNPRQNLSLIGGKFKNPFFKPQNSGLIWDGDFRPEGAAMTWLGDTFFATAEGNLLASDTDNDDEISWGVMGGTRFNLGSARLIAALQYLRFPVKGLQAIIDDQFFGNSSEIVNGTEVYKYDYNLYNAGLELSLQLFDTPVTLYGDFVRNEDADDLDTGYLFGVKVGKIGAGGSWQFGYQYEDLEADAALGLLSDSNFAGGGTDGKGHTFTGKYALNRRWALGLTYYDNTRGVDLGSDSDYKRVMLDTAFKY